MSINRIVKNFGFSVFEHFVKLKVFKQHEQDTNIELFDRNLLLVFYIVSKNHIPYTNNTINCLFVVPMSLLLMINLLNSKLFKLVQIFNFLTRYVLQWNYINMSKIYEQKFIIEIFYSKIKYGISSNNF